MSPEDHTAIHEGNHWEDDWEIFLNDFADDERTPKAKDIQDKLLEMMDLDRYKPHLNNGAPADITYQQWSAGTPQQKLGKFKRLKNGFKGLLGVLGAVGAADTAQAAFAPALALGNPVVQADYVWALKSLQAQKYAEAEQALFGNIEDHSQIFEDNPDGLVNKLLAEIHQANELSGPGLITARKKAMKKFNQWVRETNQPGC